MRILVVEDEKQLAGHISRALTRAGHSIECCYDGLSALASALADSPDLIVLDLNLPGMDGFEVMRRLREQRVQTRVIILSARGELTDRVTGLKSGADDYLAKPFAMEELLARVEVLGRRGGRDGSSDVLIVGDVRVEVRRRRVLRGGSVVAVSPREFDVLLVLMQEPGRVFTRDEICERIWEREHEYDTRTVEIFIMRLRRKLDEGRPEPLIETVRGVGYSVRPSQ